MTDDEVKKIILLKKFTGFECYGNMVEEKYTVMAIKYCREELGNLLMMSLCNCVMVC